MYNKIGVFYPVTKPVRNQIFEAFKEGEGNIINYKKMAKEVIKPEDMKVSDYKDAFEKKRKKER